MNDQISTQPLPVEAPKEGGPAQVGQPIPNKEEPKHVNT